jgi:hypothetical protein
MLLFGLLGQLNEKNEFRNQSIPNPDPAYPRWLRVLENYVAFPLSLVVD